MRVHAICLAIAAGMAFASCADIPGEAESPLAPTAPRYSASGDSIYWIDDVLEFEENGVVYRIERDQYPATKADLFRNDTLVTTVSFAYDASEVETIRYEKTKEWADADTTGTIVDTSKDWCHCPPFPEPCDPCLSFAQDCEEEREQVIKEGNEAIAAGAVALVAQTAGGPANPIALAAGVMYMKESAEYMAAILNYATCMLGETAMYTGESSAFLSMREPECFIGGRTAMPFVEYVDHRTIWPDPMRITFGRKSGSDSSRIYQLAILVG